MLIANKAVSAVNMNELLSLITSLPSGFAQRTVKRTDSRKYENSAVFTLNETADAQFSKGMREKSPQAIRLAKTFHQQALQAAELTRDPLTQAIALSRYASVLPFVEGEGMSSAVRALTDATVIARDIQAKDFASDFSGRLHFAIYLIVKNIFEQQGANSEVLSSWLRALQNTRRQAALMFRGERGQPDDNNAYRVEQGEVGFTSIERIGTDHVVQCVSPIMHNPETKQTALAHIDLATNVESLQIVLDKIGYSENGTPIQIRLLGGNDKTTNYTDMKDFFAAMAQSNILGSLEFLRTKNVDIISADIMTEEQPTCVVVDPRTFCLSEFTPSVPNPDMFFANASAALSQETRDLRTAFDLSRSKERAPILIDASMARQLTIISDQHLLDIYSMFHAHGQEMKRDIAEKVEGVLSLSGIHQDVLNGLLGAIIKKEPSLTQDNINVVWNSITQRPIYVGQNSGIANNPLFDFVEDGFVQNRGSFFRREQTLDLEGLAAIQLGSRPLELLHT